MPELPEVETVRRGLERLVVGHRILGVEVREGKSFLIDERVKSSPVGSTVIAARRRAKVLILDLDDATSLVVHLKMTGQMVVRGAETWGGGHPSDSLVDALPDRSTRVILTLDGDLRLFFNDQRKFGWIRLMPTSAVEEMEFIRRLGPEPLEPDGLDEFKRRVARHPRTSIKAALLDQSVVAGIGNIYADEALWAARVNPSRLVADVSAVKLRQLFESARDVMELSLSLGGSTDRNYVDAEGRRGAYLDFAHVFRRDGDPCHRCGTTIKKTRVAGRGTHYCPHCQRR
ncbi:MAG: bifunctional DNA-formamidopyrimidine glycosylase/DNA-(apurinic or apyrimidinic site) lyase [Propionibacteriaceae bacterium]|nr:bifunctional DNA-formamidopyrimidine glycosylase/DNA-(apurinic or apyrimidinic site) lyase [Propionibacteriaceae bacterium]